MPNPFYPDFTIPDVNDLLLPRRKRKKATSTYILKYPKL